jgi:hypothetical protein
VESSQHRALLKACIEDPHASPRMGLLNGLHCWFNLHCGIGGHTDNLVLGRSRQGAADVQYRSKCFDLLDRYNVAQKHECFEQNHAEACERDSAHDIKRPARKSGLERRLDYVR